MAAGTARRPRTQAGEQAGEQAKMTAPEAARKPAPHVAPSAAPAPSPAPAPSRPSARGPELAASQKKPVGRVARGLGLIGAGIRTLFSGK